MHTWPRIQGSCSEPNQTSFELSTDKTIRWEFVQSLKSTNTCTFNDSAQFDKKGYHATAKLILNE